MYLGGILGNFGQVSMFLTLLWKHMHLLWNIYEIIHICTAVVDESEV